MIGSIKVNVIFIVWMGFNYIKLKLSSTYDPWIILLHSKKTDNAKIKKDKPKTIYFKR